MEYTATVKIVAVMLAMVNILFADASPIASDTVCGSNLEDQHLPDPSDCSRYFRCVYGRRVPKQCPEQMLFNPTIGNCDLYYNVECPSPAPLNDAEEQDLTQAIENLTGRTFVRNPKVSGPSGRSDLEEATKTDRFVETSTLKFVYLPHDKDPNAYYKVENGEKLLLLCEDGMVFSFELEICAKSLYFDPK